MNHFNQDLNNNTINNRSRSRHSILRSNNLKIFSSNNSDQIDNPSQITSIFDDFGQFKNNNSFKKNLTNPKTFHFNPYNKFNNTNHYHKRISSFLPTSNPNLNSINNSNTKLFNDNKLNQDPLSSSKLIKSKNLSKIDKKSTKLSLFNKNSFSSNNSLKSNQSTTSASISLLNKCLDWIFPNKNSSKSKSNSIQQVDQQDQIDHQDQEHDQHDQHDQDQIDHQDQINDQVQEQAQDQEQKNQIPNSSQQQLTNPIPIQSSNLIYNSKNHLVSSTFPNSSSSISKQNQNHLNPLDLNPKNNSVNQFDSKIWFKSQSPFVSNPIHSSIKPLLSTTLNQPKRKTPVTAHATLDIPIPNPSTINSFNNLRSTSNLFNSSSNFLNSNQPSLPKFRSVSPIRNLSGSNHIINPHIASRRTSSIFPSFNKSNLSSNTLTHQQNLNTNLNHNSISTSSNQTQSITRNSLSNKRGRDDSSVSPIRQQSLYQASVGNGLFNETIQSNKRQMCWDPDLGFVTQEQRQKILEERERKLREKEGRPYPINEAERILEILELGWNPTFSLGNKPRTSLIPKISVPAPSVRSSSCRSHSINRKNGTSLTAIREEQALHSNSQPIIAPITKKLEADRIKRLEEKKGKLRAEIKKRKKFMENLERQRLDQLNEAHEIDSNHKRKVDSEAVTNGTTQSKRRSISNETEKLSGHRRKSSRKVGKLTSEATKAKVNQGRKSRSQSVNEDHVGEQINKLPSNKRVTRSSKIKSSLDQIESGEISNNSTLSTNQKSSKSFINIKTPSTIQEETAEQVKENDQRKDDKQTQSQSKLSTSTLLQPVGRNPSVSLRSPLVDLIRSTPRPTLRPGRTFTTRRHNRAKVFSAREEDLPKLSAEDELEPDSRNDHLKKIKLPNVFLSSFKLDKLTPIPEHSQSQADPINSSNLTSTESNSKLTSSNIDTNSLLSRIDPTPTNTISQDVTPTITIATTSAPAQASTTSILAPSSFSFLKPDQPSASSSSFSFTNNPPIIHPIQSSSSEQVQSFSKIPSALPPPNFFSAITAPTITTNQQTLESSEQTKTSNIEPQALFRDPSPQPTPPAQIVSEAMIESAPNTIELSDPKVNQTKPTSGLFSFSNLNNKQGLPTSSSTETLATVPPTNPPTNLFQSNPSTSLPVQSTSLFSFGTPTPSLFGSVAPSTTNFSSQSNPSLVPSVSVTSPLPATTTFNFSQPSITQSIPSQGSVSNLFGTTKPISENPKPSSLFSATPNTTSSLAPTSSSTGFSFTNPINPTPSKPEAIFGNPSSSSSTSLSFAFGAPSSQIDIEPTPPASSSVPIPATTTVVNNSSPFIFGSSNNTASNPSSQFAFSANSSSNLCSAPVATQSIFGSSAVPPTSNPGFAFTSSTTTSDGPGSTINNSVFGSTAATASTSGLFGNSNSGGASTFPFGDPASGFGSNAAITQTEPPKPFIFGSTVATENKMFGNPTNNTGTGFGNGGTLFGNSNTNSVSTGFNNTNASIFGGNGMVGTNPTIGNGNLFGNNNPTSNNPLINTTTFQFSTPNSTNNSLTNSGMGNINPMNGGATINPVPTTPVPAPGGFVFNMGSSNGPTNSPSVGSSRRPMKALPSGRKKR